MGKKEYPGYCVECFKPIEDEVICNSCQEHISNLNDHFGSIKDEIE